MRWTSLHPSSGAVSGLHEGVKLWVHSMAHRSGSRNSISLLCDSRGTLAGPILPKREVNMRLGVWSCASLIVSHPAGTKYRLKTTPTLPLGFSPWLLPPAVRAPLPSHKSRARSPGEGTVPLMAAPSPASLQLLSPRGPGPLVCLTANRSNVLPSSGVP